MHGIDRYAGSSGISDILSAPGLLMPRLFAYGSMMCPEVIEKLAGKPLTGVPGKVKNHRALCVRGELYPGMVQGHGGEVSGLVYTFPSYLWPAFDAFEGEEYLRKPVRVWYDNGKRELVQAYLFRPEYRSRLIRRPWDFDAFVRDGLQSFVAQHFPPRPLSNPIANYLP